VKFLGFEGRPGVDFFGKSLNCAQQIMADEPSAIQRTHANGGGVAIELANLALEP
jgi:hypothetical protein